MSAKIRPLGICDHCGGAIRTGYWYTSKGQPRRYCSLDCRNTANSRAGASIRSQKQLEHVQKGEWQNPHLLNPPTGAEQARRARLGRRREVLAGCWRNPGLTPEAREINSRPRKHSGALASAIEKLKAAKCVADLTPEEQEAHRVYRKQLQKSRWTSMTEAEREQRREQYRQSWRKRHSQKQ